MATARDKVVKVENVSSSVHFGSDTFLGRDENVQEKPLSGFSMDSRNNSNTYMQVPVPVLILGGHRESTTSEQIEVGESVSQAGVTQLPDGWPKIPEVFDKQSWNFSTSVHPSVNKATSHLELLQNVIEEWSHEAINESLTKLSNASSPTISWKSKPKGDGTSRLPPLKSTPGPGSLPTSAIINKANEVPGLDIPYLGAEEVIKEVITLLAKLENDRCETREALDKEKERVQMLSDKIDHLARERLLKLPNAVQDEHDACAADLIELNWHVTNRGRMEAKILQKVQGARALNEKLKEDITFVKNHCPLVEEKLALESDAMEKIRRAQTETTDELEVTAQRVDKVRIKAEEAKAKAEAEKEYIQKDLDQVREDLRRASEDLAKEKMISNNYMIHCNECREQTIANKQEIQVLEVKNENIMSTEAEQTKRVEELQAKILVEEAERKKLEEENTQARRKVKYRKSVQEKETEKLLKIIEEKTAEKKTLVSSNKEYDMNIEDLKTKIKKCDKQKIADAKNLDRMKRDSANVEKQTEVVMNDLEEVRVIHKSMAEKLMKEEMVAAHSEEKLKQTAEQLRKQINEEIHNKAMMQARIKDDSGQKGSLSQNVSEKQAKVQAKADEINNAVNSIKEKVGRLQASRKQKAELLAKLRNDLMQTQAEMEKIDAWEKEMDAEMVPKHEAIKSATKSPSRGLVVVPEEPIESTYIMLQKSVVETEKKIDGMEYQSVMMTKSMQDMAESKRMMEKANNKTNAAIEELTKEVEELEIQSKANMAIVSELEKQLKEVSDRMKIQEKEHKQLMEERRNVHKSLDKKLLVNLEMNRQLAAKYRKLRLRFILEKNAVMDKLSDSIVKENAVKDSRQLQGLQEHMYNALSTYYKYRGMYNKNELATVVEEAHQNTEMIGDLKIQIDDSLKDMSNFMAGEMDGQGAKKMAMEKVMAEERTQKLIREANALTQRVELSSAV